MQLHFLQTRGSIPNPNSNNLLTCLCGAVIYTVDWLVRHSIYPMLVSRCQRMQLTTTEYAVGLISPTTCNGQWFCHAYSERQLPRRDCQSFVAPCAKSKRVNGYLMFGCGKDTASCDDKHSSRKFGTRYTPRPRKGHALCQRSCDERGDSIRLVCIPYTTARFCWFVLTITLCLYFSQ
jgi:hypothetical protein